MLVVYDCLKVGRIYGFSVTKSGNILLKLVVYYLFWLVSFCENLN